jgi:hypothetical protein
LLFGVGETALRDASSRAGGYARSTDSRQIGWGGGLNLITRTAQNLRIPRFFEKKQKIYAKTAVFSMNHLTSLCRFGMVTSYSVIGWLKLMVFVHVLLTVGVSKYYTSPPPLSQKNIWELLF